MTVAASVETRLTLVVVVSARAGASSTAFVEGGMVLFSGDWPV